MKAPSRGSDAALRGILSRHRRRLMAVQFVKHGCIAAGASLLIVDAVVISPSARTAWASTAVWSVAAAMAWAALASLARRPSVGRTAANMDERLGLHDELLTAVQFEGDPDPFSRLLVRHAVERVRHIRPSSLFPFEVPSLARGLTIAAAIVAVVFLVAPGSSVRTWRSRDFTPEQMVGGSATSPPRTDGRSSGHATIETRESSSAPLSGPTARADEPQHPTRDRITAPGPDGKGADASGEVRPASVTAGDRDQRASALAAGIDRDNRQTGSIGRAGDPVSDGTSGHGGVKEGTLVQDDPAVATNVRNGAAPVNARAYRAAWSRAQTAIAQDKVPEDLRPYVKRYFTAIREPRQP